MSSIKIILSAIFLCFLCSCSLFEPYIDRRRNPGTQDLSRLYRGPSKPDAPAICYNPLISNDAKLQQMADAECQKEKTGTHAVFTKKTILDCKLLLPNHAYYKCIK